MIAEKRSTIPPPPKFWRVLFQRRTRASLILVQVCTLLSHPSPVTTHVPPLTYYVDGLVSDRGLEVLLGGLHVQIFPVDGKALVIILKQIKEHDVNNSRSRHM